MAERFRVEGKSELESAAALGRVLYALDLRVVISRYYVSVDSVWHHLNLIRYISYGFSLSML